MMIGPHHCETHLFPGKSVIGSSRIWRARCCAAHRLARVKAREALKCVEKSFHFSQISASILGGKPQGTFCRLFVSRFHMPHVRCAMRERAPCPWPESGCPSLAHSEGEVPPSPSASLSSSHYNKQHLESGLLRPQSTCRFAGPHRRHFLCTKILQLQRLIVNSVWPISAHESGSDKGIN